MPDPNARGNKILEDILKAMNKQNDLLAAQNKILDKMERHGRPTVITSRHPYLERSEREDGEIRSGANDSQSAAGTDGAVQEGNSGTAR